MPSLADLATPQAIEAFAQSVAKRAVEFRFETIDLNGGIRTTAELNAHIEKGLTVPFDYQRLIDEASSFN